MRNTKRYFPANNNYLEPWKEVRYIDGAKFVAELMNEIKDHHPLCYCKVYALARRIDNDDVLFRVLGDHEYFVVAHLTWNESQQPLPPRGATCHPRQSKNPASNAGFLLFLRASHEGFKTPTTD